MSRTILSMAVLAALFGSSIAYAGETCTTEDGQVTKNCAFIPDTTLYMKCDVSQKICIQIECDANNNCKNLAPIPEGCTDEGKYLSCAPKLPPPVVGGYSPVSVSEPNVVNAASFAAKQLGSPVKTVYTAEQQVVAGSNFRLYIELVNGSKYNVTVYQDLSGSWELTSKTLVSSDIATPTPPIALPPTVPEEGYISTPKPKAPISASQPDPRMKQIANKLKQQMNQWKIMQQTMRVSGYTYTLQYSGFIAPAGATPINITVANGKVVSAITEDLNATGNTDAIPTAMINATDRALTVDQLFSKIQDAINAKSAKINVKYNSKWGFPTSIFVDTDTRIADEEIALKATEFSPTKKTPTPKTLLK